MGDTPPGTAVTFSLVLRPTVPAPVWPWLPLLVGHNVAKALTTLRYDAQVKWPNDVLLDGEAKVAGILVERVETPTGPAAIVGVGINVGMSAEELPVPTATSLAIVGAGAPDRVHVLAEVLAAIREGYDVWQVGGDAAIARLATSYRSHCATLGRDVRVSLPGGGELVGRATDIDEQGRLVVETGEAREIHHLATLIGYGATAVNPYLMLDSLRMNTIFLLCSLATRRIAGGKVTACSRKFGLAAIGLTRL